MTVRTRSAQRPARRLYRVSEAFPFAFGQWRLDDRKSRQTCDRMERAATNFQTRLTLGDVRGIRGITTDDCRRFVEAPTRNAQPPSSSTMRWRRTVVRELFQVWREAGLTVGDPTLDLDLPPRTPVSTRPLSNAEIMLGRSAVLIETGIWQRRCVAWALAEATATTAEIPLITHHSFDSITDPHVVALPGSHRVRPRQVALTDWGRAQIRGWLEQLAPDESSLTYVGDAKARSMEQQSATHNLIFKTLTLIGLDHDPDIRPASVRYWRARSVFDQTGSISKAANLLGTNSLDAAASAIGWNWKEPQ